jgi:hypothetical protein
MDCDLKIAFGRQIKALLEEGRLLKVMCIVGLGNGIGGLGPVCRRP